jgi:LuxR family maltose regulon positive regulatory protein
MLDISVLDELTAGACAAVTGRPDVAVLLRSADAANLFLVALDDDRTSFRYHPLVRQLLNAELRARDRDREQTLQLRAAEWFEAMGDPRRAARHFLTARRPSAALTMLQDGVVTDFLQEPRLPAPLDLSIVDPALLADAPEQLLGLAADLLLSGETARGGEYLDLLERARQSIPPDSRQAARFAAMRSFRYAVTGQLDQAIAEALRARDIQQETQLTDDWNSAVPLMLLRVYPCLEDIQAVECEAALALATSSIPEPAKLVLVPGAQAVTWVQAGHLAEAAAAARAAAAASRRLGFDQHFFAVDYLRAQAGLALEQRDLDTAEQITEQVLSISERRRPLFEFLALLDRAAIWAARGQVREALSTIDAARHVLPGATPVLLARADELEALLRLSLGDLHTPTELGSGLAAASRGLLLARISLASDDYRAAQENLQSPSLGELTPRRALVRQLLLAATAIGRGDPTAAGVLGDALRMAREGGFLNTVVTTAPQVPSYLIEHSTPRRPDPFTEQLTAAALEVHAAQPWTANSGRVPAEQLTAAEVRILELLPTSTYLQMAAILYVSRNTVKTHLKSIYQKLGVASRAEALERAVDLHLL